MSHSITFNVNFIFGSDGGLEMSTGEGEEVFIDEDELMETPEGAEAVVPPPMEAKAKRSRKKKPEFGFVRF